MPVSISLRSWGEHRLSEYTKEDVGRILSWMMNGGAFQAAEYIQEGMPQSFHDPASGNTNVAELVDLENALRVCLPHIPYRATHLALRYGKGRTATEVALDLDVPYATMIADIDRDTELIASAMNSAQVRWELQEGKC